MRSYRVLIDVEHRSGDRGYLLAHGDQGGGYGVYVDGDAVHYVHNDGRSTTRTLSGGALGPGEHAPDSAVRVVDVLREMGRRFE